MNNANHKPSGFDYEPVGKVYSSNTQIIKHKDGTISLKPASQTTNKNSK